MSIRRMMLFTLGGFFKSIISLFKTRVLNDGGTFEAETKLENQLNTLGSTLFDSASLVITPNGVKTSKLYSIKPSDGTGDLTVVRATSATRVNENGLIEIPATNLVLRSEEFNDAYWFKANTVITPNQTLSPINTLTADLISESNTINKLFYLYSLSPLISVQQGIWYTASIYVKKGIGITAPDIIQMTFNGNRFGSLQYANFNIVSGTVTYSQNGNASIKALADGWFRISWTASATSTGADNFIPIIFCNNNPTSLRAPVYNGKNTSDIFIWGAQVEQGMTATEYIPTTSVIRTRFAGITQDGGSASNIPRIDYTTGSPAILVENQRTNLLSRSEEFENSYWQKAGCNITPNNILSPSGTLSADKFQISANTPVMFTTFTTLTSPITLSFHIKKGNSPTSANRIGIRNGTTGKLATASINTDTGEITIIGNNIGGTFSSIKMANGWFRFICTVNSNIVNGDGINIYVGGLGSLAPNDIVGNYSYIWGAQLEAGSNATSYIPTVNGSVTRNADVISKNGLIGISEIKETFENGTTNVISGNPTNYTMSQGRIKQVLGL